MNNISDKLNIINGSKNDIKTAIENKGISVGEVGIQEYASKINEIPSPPTKGIIVEECDDSGYATKVRVVGLTSIPAYGFNTYSSSESNFLTKKLQTIIIEEGVTSIGNYAFSNCSSLVGKMELPTTLTYIGQNAFYMCDKLEELVCLGDMKTFNNNCLYEATRLKKLIMPNITKAPTATMYSFSSSAISSGNCIIYVPDNLIDTMKSASIWKNYANQIKPISEL